MGIQKKDYYGGVEMTKKEAVKILTAKDNVDLFDEMYQEKGDEFFCNFFDALTEETIDVNVDDFSQREYEDFTAEVVFSEHSVAQSNSATDDYSEEYFQDPEPLLKVVCASQDPLNPGNLEFSWYWLTMDGLNEVKEIIRRYKK